jgi:hypothetical protein
MNAPLLMEAPLSFSIHSAKDLNDYHFFLNRVDRLNYLTDNFDHQKNILPPH